MIEKSKESQYFDRKKKEKGRAVLIEKQFEVNILIVDAIDSRHFDRKSHKTVYIIIEKSKDVLIGKPKVDFFDRKKRFRAPLIFFLLVGISRSKKILRSTAVTTVYFSVSCIVC